MNTVKDILEDRAKTHGNYSDIVECRASILTALTKCYNINNANTQLNMELVIMWNDIALKLARSASEPKHKDSWDDLAGYAILIQQLKGTTNG